MEKRETLSVAEQERVVEPPGLMVEGLTVKDVMVGGVVSLDSPLPPPPPPEPPSLEEVSCHSKVEISGRSHSYVVPYTSI